MEEKIFSRDELHGSDGKEGRPAYVAYEGRVVDVTGSRLWKGGIHMMRHQAGQDLTADIEAAPHGPEVLDRYQEVGTLAEERAAEREIPDLVSRLLVRFPLLARHPHPMMVHFPTVFFLAAGFFSILYLITGHQPFEATAFHSLCGGLFFMPAAMGTGFFTWWLNYAANRMRAITIKITLASILLPLTTAAVIWRFLIDDVLDHLADFGWLYLVFVLASSPLVLVISYYGGTLTFPVKKTR